MGEIRKHKPKTPPGVLIGFELLDAIKLLPDEAAGKFLRAVLEYAAHHKEPHFNNDLALNMLWAMMRQKIDYNNAHYDEISLKKRYAAYRKSQKDMPNEPWTFDEWLEHVEEEEESL